MADSLTIVGPYQTRYYAGVLGEIPCNPDESCILLYSPDHEAYTVANDVVMHTTFDESQWVWIVENMDGSFWSGGDGWCSQLKDAPDIVLSCLTFR